MHNSLPHLDHWIYETSFIMSLHLSPVNYMLQEFPKNCTMSKQHDLISSDNVEWEKAQSRSYFPYLNRVETTKLVNSWHSSTQCGKADENLKPSIIQNGKESVKSISDASRHRWSYIWLLSEIYQALSISIIRYLNWGPRPNGIE